MKLARQHTRFGGAEVLEHRYDDVELASPWAYEQRLVLPNNAIVNGNFIRDANWTKGANWTIAGGVAHHDALALEDLSAANAPLTAGVKYRVRYDALNGIDWFRVVCGTQIGATTNGDGTFEEDVIANGAGFKFEIVGNQFPIVDGDIDNVSATVMPDDRSLRMHLRRVHAGYDASGATDGSSLTIEWKQGGTTNYFTWYPPSVGMGTVLLPHGGIIGDPDTLIILTLSAGGGGIKGKINAFYEWV